MTCSLAKKFLNSILEIQVILNILTQSCIQIDGLNLIRLNAKQIKMCHIHTPFGLIGQIQSNFFKSKSSFEEVV